MTPHERVEAFIGRLSDPSEKYRRVIDEDAGKVLTIADRYCTSQAGRVRAAISSGDGLLLISECKRLLGFVPRDA